MIGAVKRKSSLLPGFAALRLVLLLIVTLCLGETRVWGFAITPQPTSGVFESVTPSCIGQNTTAIGYDASDSLHAAKRSLWTSTKGKTWVENAFEHWQKHGAEFPEFQNANQYVEGAHRFFSSPPAGTLTKTRPNGDTLFYNPGNNTFGVQAADG